MGKFGCHCGYTISDSIYPCPYAGELKWETESELQSEKTSQTVKNFLDSVENKQDKVWIENYFGDNYPSNLSIATVVDDIYSKISGEQGRSVYQCPECERLYLQKEFHANEWICFEKRVNSESE